MCSGPTASALTAREMHHGTRECFDYLECGRCGCLQIAEIPTDLDRFYPPDYYTRAAVGSTRRAGPGASPLARAATRMRLAIGPLAALLPGRRYGRFGWFTRTQTGTRDAILEVGCGSGALIQRLDRAGFRDLTGIDPRLPEAESDPARGSPRLLRASLTDHRGRYRLVMAHHSFEHLEDPVAAFSAFAGLVEPGGWLLLRTPRADGWARRRYGADWVQLDAPRHLHLHTRRSIEWLAASSGFRLVRVVDDSRPFQIWGSELYRRDVPLSRARRWGRPHLSFATRLAARLRATGLRLRGLGDQACFYLQRDVEGPAERAGVRS